MKDDDDPADEEYWGNMWGWKLSYLGLALIVLMLALMGVRKCQLDEAEANQIQIEATDE